MNRNEWYKLTGIGVTSGPEYAHLLEQWICMRNFLIHSWKSFAEKQPELQKEYDIMYGKSLEYIGKMMLACSNRDLITKTNELNEEIYRKPFSIDPQVGPNPFLGEVKQKAEALLSLFREDVGKSCSLNIFKEI